MIPRAGGRIPGTLTLAALPLAALRPLLAGAVSLAAALAPGVAPPLAALSPAVALQAAEGEAEAGGLFVRVHRGEPVTDGGLSRGVAWGDYDGDGDPDLAVANTIGWPEFLYRNDGDGTFTEIHEVAPTLAAGWTEGIHWVDADGDGDLELFVANGRGGPDHLFAAVADGSFRRLEAGELTRDSLSSTQACWADYDGDGDLDALVVRPEGLDDALYWNAGARSPVGTVPAGPPGRAGPDASAAPAAEDGVWFVRAREGPWIGRGGEGRACAAGDADGDPRRAPRAAGDEPGR